MSVAIAERDPQLEVPASWPASLHPAILARVDHPTPYLICDLETVRERYRRFTRVLPDFNCYYAVKCNAAPEVLETLAELGSSFEIASLGELELLQSIDIDPRDVIHSNPVKPPAHIAASYAAGLSRFAFDSENELYKLARHAPGCSVYLRVRVDDSTSVFPLSRKFGVEPPQAKSLLLLARRLGLRPYGVTFHVGSQCTDPRAWQAAIGSMGSLLAELDDAGLRLEMLNVSGGFPARYADPVPEPEHIAGSILPALERDLPYVPSHLAAEPGRYLVAESSVLAAGVIGREVRAGESWIYLDVGAYNGLIETTQTRHRWRYPLWSSRRDHAEALQDFFTVTGPTCDSSDTLFFGAALPSTLEVGDTLYIGSAGAYTMSYASSFNGFPPPTLLYVGER